MKTKFLACLALLVFGCSGAQVAGGEGKGGDNETTLKKSAAEAHAAGTATTDACAEHGWYGDGTCDTFCTDLDSQDCSPSNDGPPIACAEFLEEEDGKCGRSPNDPCRSQDPDCIPTGQPDPSTIVCTEIGQLPDGICKSDPADPCIEHQDPDCRRTTPPSQGGGSPGSGGTGGIACTAIAQVADGVCKDDPSDPCLALQDPDCGASGGTGVVCAEYIEVSDGVCKREPTDPCLSQDPDCKTGGGVACAEYIEVSDGVCKREPVDPCIFQDPDCAAK